MKFLVTGSTGLIGSQVVKDLAKSTDQVYACYHNSKPDFGIPTQMDLTNSENIKKTIEKIKPDAILHLAAMTNIDQCETQKEYVSTDYVFNGEHGMKKENDQTNPINFYGESKLEGEKAIMDMTSSWCIARTSTPFGIHKTRKSFPVFVAENLRAKKKIKVITDQYTSSTYVPNLSRMLIELAHRQIVGIIHVAGATRVSRFEMATMIVDKLNLDKNLIKSTTIDEMRWIARRPRDTSLDISKATSLLNEKPMAIEQSLDYFVQELNQQAK
jgi:dTDP-4-dehydrorhamnose reductase